MRRAAATGFTLIELMVAIAVGAVLASWALPNLNYLVARVKLKTAASDLHTSLTLARSEAIKRNAAVTVTPVSTSDWSQGWSVKFGTTVLSTQVAYSNIGFVPRNAAYGTKTVSSITFQGTGREGSTDGIAFILRSTAQTTIDARCIVLDPSGRASVRVDSNRDYTDGCN